MSPEELCQLASRTRYPAEAFFFIQRGLDFTVRRAHGEVDPHNLALHYHPSRHVSGRQLCLGLRDYAVQEYGLMARAVLRHWNIHSCEDFGRIVFAMVEGGLMHKTSDDSIDDFQGVFRFAEAFEPEALDLDLVGATAVA
jgi:uncharacterized repeat protein (TIGR04138 family)